MTKPFQFTLKTFFILTAMSAGVTWLYSRPPPGSITIWQADRIEVGMTKEEVVAILGGTGETIWTNPSDRLAYRVHRPFSSESWLGLSFDRTSHCVVAIYR